MKYQFTSEQLINALQEVVSCNPDYVYAVPDANAGTAIECRYVHTDEVGRHTPGCGVGFALNRLGVPLHTLATMEGQDARDVVEKVSNLSWEDPAVLLLQDFQLEQDQGTSWGESFELAYQSLHYM